MDNSFFEIKYPRVYVNIINSISVRHNLKIRIFVPIFIIYLFSYGANIIMDPVYDESAGNRPFVNHFSQTFFLH